MCYIKLQIKLAVAVTLPDTLINASFYFSSTQASPKEDVLYATIDHGDERIPGHGTNTGRRDSMDNDCDYAEVKLPSEIAKKSINSEDCADDYVLMS